MKKIAHIALAVGLLGSLSAYAQSKFDGAYGQIGVGYESVSPSFSSTGLNIIGIGRYPINTSVGTSSGVTGALSAGYYGSINSNFLLGVGVDYNPFSSQSGNYSYGVGSIASVSGNYKRTSSYNVFISPATPIGKDGLLYGKVGYTGATLDTTEGGSTSSTNYTGLSIGLGYKQIIQGGLYGFGEVNYASYGNKSSTPSGSVAGYNYSYQTTSSANTFNALVGVGYKF